MPDGFAHALNAIASDISIFTGSLIGNNQLTGFVIGFIVALLVSGLIVTKDPRHIPMILRHSSMESFEQLKESNVAHFSNLAFHEYVKIYLLLRIIFLIAFIALCGMIISIMV